MVVSQHHVEKDVHDAEMQEDRRHEPPHFAIFDVFQSVVALSTVGVDDDRPKSKGIFPT